MSQIDVTELLSDPDFVDRCQLINRTPQVNTAGESLLDDDPINTVGSVQPADGKTVQRVPENMWVANMMSFWIQGKITAVSPGKYSSILVFKGQRYEVKHVFDWTAAGAGWCEGLCVQELAAP